MACPSAATTARSLVVTDTSGAQTVLGSVRLRITATPAGGGQQLFLGIGPAGAVDRYLRGASYDVATDVSVAPFHLTLARHRGTATPVSAATSALNWPRSSIPTRPCAWV